MGQQKSKIPTVKQSDQKHPHPTPPVVPPIDLNRFNKNGLKAHRNYRRAHNAPRMFLDRKLVKLAQEWAEHLAKVDSLDRQENVKYGVNLYFCQGFTPTGFRSVQRWYEEIEDYDFDSPQYSEATAHFTQVIWGQSRKLGMGVGRSSSGNYYVVAYYHPPGNVKTMFGENVFRCGADPPKVVEDPTVVDRIKLTFHIFNQFQKECLAVHNTYRTHHGVPELVLGVQICKDAQDWAENLASENKMKTQGNSIYGENIFSVTKDTVDGRMPVEAWYAERAQYNGNYSVATGHFSQVVWAASTELGVGVARSTSGQVFVVAYYFPPGNIQSEYDANVRNWKKV